MAFGMKKQNSPSPGRVLCPWHPLPWMSLWGGGVCLCQDIRGPPATGCQALPPALLQQLPTSGMLSRLLHAHLEILREGNQANFTKYSGSQNTRCPEGNHHRWAGQGISKYLLTRMFA